MSSLIFFVFLIVVIFGKDVQFESYSCCLSGHFHLISFGDNAQSNNIMSKSSSIQLKLSDFTILTSTTRQPLQTYINETVKQLKPVQFSLIIPAFNETKRLPKMLPPTIEYFEKKGFTYEIIVVNDASKDETPKAALDLAKYNGKPIDIKCLTYTTNQGKGGAIRSGMMAARGEYCLMVDADGATEINDFEKCLHKLKTIEKDGYGIVAGTRLGEDSQAERKGIRLLLSVVSAFIVQTICGVKLNDTQCGFKLFTQKTAKRLFKPLHIRRWAFDVEMFVIANYMGIPYGGCSVRWQDIEGSKLNIVSDTLQMTRDYILIKLLYVLGLWTIHDTDSIWESYLPSGKVDSTAKKSD